MSTPTASTHQIRVRLAGLLGAHWNGRFHGVEVVESPDGDTILSGRIADLSALFGILRLVESLGAPVVSIFAYPADGRRG